MGDMNLQKDSNCQQDTCTGIPAVQEYLQLSVWLGKHQVPAIRKNFISNGLKCGHTAIPKKLHTMPPDLVPSKTPSFSYAEQNAILLPGHIPYQKWDDIKLLPSSDSKMIINS